MFTIISRDISPLPDTTLIYVMPSSVNSDVVELLNASPLTLFRRSMRFVTPVVAPGIFSGYAIMGGKHSNVVLYSPVPQKRITLVEKSAAEEFTFISKNTRCLRSIFFVSGIMHMGDRHRIVGGDGLGRERLLSSAPPSLM